MPFDPPRRLVTSGPYAYIANPMQAAACLVLVALAVLLGCGWLAVAALIDVVYGAGIAGWHEHEYMRGRFEQPWRAPGWAFVGWTLRLPIVRPVGQVLVDASGGGPRRVSRARPAR